MSGIIKLSRNTENAPMSTVSSQSVAFSHYNNISAQLPIDPKTNSIVEGCIDVQIRQCLNNIKAIVESINHNMDDVVKLNVFLKSIPDIEHVDNVMNEFFKDYFPTRTVIAVSELPISDALVQIDALISNGEGTPSQEPCNLIKLARNTDNAPKSCKSTQTVAFSHYNNISAQLPLDPKTGSIIQGGVQEQAKQCLSNIKAILENIDVPFDDIVKVNIFVKDLEHIQAINEVYNSFFPDSAIARAVGYVPARTTIAVSDLTMNALVQMDAVVSHGDGTPPQEVEDRHRIVIKANNTKKAPRSALSTQTVAFSHYNHIAGQLPLDTTTRTLINGGIKEQAKQCLDHIKTIVESIDHVMDDIVKVNIQLRDISEIETVDEVYKTYFSQKLPARTVVGLSAIPMDALIQVDAVVSNGEGTAP